MHEGPVLLDNSKLKRFNRAKKKPGLAGLKFYCLPIFFSVTLETADDLLIFPDE